LKISTSGLPLHGLQCCKYLLRLHLRLVLRLLRFGLHGCGEG
jgi:hypothetical protein